MAELSFK